MNLRITDDQQPLLIVKRQCARTTNHTIDSFVVVIANLLHHQQLLDESEDIGWMDSLADCQETTCKESKHTIDSFVVVVDLISS